MLKAVVKVYNQPEPRLPVTRGVSSEVPKAQNTLESISGLVFEFTVIADTPEALDAKVDKMMKANTNG